jgi:NAD(P)H-nitrite reductase large subunit
MAKYVIVGASAAGLAAVEAIRKVDQNGAITVITDEACVDYSRPMISDLVSGKADLNMMRCKADSFWKEKNAEVRMGKKAVSLNLTDKTVSLEDGEKVVYEKLLLLGGKPLFLK